MVLGRYPPRCHTSGCDEIHTCFAEEVKAEVSDLLER
jgi:hypothetical protein